jgi:hypothetical protein
MPQGILISYSSVVTIVRLEYVIASSYSVPHVVMSLYCIQFLSAAHILLCCSV